MKKSLIALAVMAAAGAASAQSSVTLFGVVDAAITHTRANNGGGDWTGMSNSGYNSSRLGFRGTEDLGGGMSASFWLEGSVANDDGGTGFNFQRRSTVSLAGGWGELRLGRDYTPAFWNLTVFDPFGTNGVGTNVMLRGVNAMAGNITVGTTATTTLVGRNTVRNSNSIGYFLPPNLGGFYGQVNYWFGENDIVGGGTTAEDDGDGFGLRLGYGSGPWNVAVGYSKTNSSVTGDLSMLNIGGQWDFGMAKLMAQYSRDELAGVGAAGDTDGRGWLIGVLVPVGAGEIRASYGDYRIDIGGSDPRARQLAVGYVHNLSKRTAVYATIARVRSSNGMPVNVGTSSAQAGFGTGNFNSTGYDIGIRHSF